LSARNHVTRSTFHVTSIPLHDEFLFRSKMKVSLRARSSIQLYFTPRRLARGYRACYLLSHDSDWLSVISSKFPRQVYRQSSITVLFLGRGLGATLIIVLLL
jgi:hypothetical protein